MKNFSALLTDQVLHRWARLALSILIISMPLALSAGKGKKKCPFVVNPKSATVCPGASVIFDALEGNTGKKIHLVSVTQPVNGGTVTIDRKNNTFTYTALRTIPASGTDEFTYTLEDCRGCQKTAPVFITIICCEPFNVNDIFITVSPGSSIVIDTLEGNTGCNLSLVRVTQPVNGGTAVPNTSNGTVRYTTPANPAIRSDSFTYTLQSQFPTAEKTATIHITISPCTTPFVVRDKSGTVPALGTITFDALAGNSGSGLALVSVTQPINGGTSVADPANNRFSYTASNPSATSDMFTYTMKANCPPEAEQTADVFITIVPSPCTVPLHVNPQNAVVCPGGAHIFDTTARNSGCALSLVSVGEPLSPQFGTITKQGNNAVYVSDPGTPDGTIDTMSYTMSGSGSTATSTLTVRVVDQPFTVNPLSALACAGSTITFDPFAVNNGCGAVVIAVQPIPANQGTLSFDPATGIITLVTAADLPDGFVIRSMYTEQQGNVQKSNTITVTIRTEPFGVTPLSLTACPSQTQVIDIHRVYSGCNLKIVAVTQPLFGTAVVSGDTVIYTAPAQVPPVNDRFAIDVSSTTPPGGSKIGTVDVEVINKPFMVNPVTGSVGVGQSLTLFPLAVSGTCNATLVSATIDDPTQGTLTPIFSPTIEIIYNPPATPLVPGTIVTGSYTLQQDGVQMTAPVIILIVNIPDIADPVEGSVCPGGSVTMTPLDTGPGGNRVVLRVFQPPVGQGSVSLNADQTITYYAPADIPVDTVVTFFFQVALADNLSVTAIGTGTITIVGTPFVADPLVGNSFPGGNILFDPLAVGSGCNRKLLSVAPFPDGQATITTHPDGTFTVTISPNLQPGTVIQSSYALIDAHGNTRSAPIIIFIEPTPPFTVPDFVGTACPGGSAIFAPLNFGTGANRELVSVAIVPQPGKNLGTATINTLAPDTFTYRAPIDIDPGTVVEIKYMVAGDENGMRVTKTGTITVTILNEPFNVVNLTGQVLPGGRILFDPLILSTGCDLRLVGVTQPPPGQGTVIPNFVTTPGAPANTFFYIAPVNIAPGTLVQFTYTLIDASGTLQTATVTVLILPVTQVPQCDPFITLYNRLILGECCLCCCCCLNRT